MKPEQRKHSQVDHKSATVLADVVPQNPFIGKSFSTVLTHEGFWKEQSRKCQTFFFLNSYV